VREDTEGTGQISLTRSVESFDCFSKCIEDKTCKRLTRIHPHIATSYSDCYSKSNVGIGSVEKDGQYAIIKGIFFTNTFDNL
jgi:hypothetical protein